MRIFLFKKSSVDFLLKPSENYINNFLSVLSFGELLALCKYFRLKSLKILFWQKVWGLFALDLKYKAINMLFVLLRFVVEQMEVKWEITDFLDAL